jgi:hypothetical protein
MLSTQLRNEELREDEMRVHYCELEQGSILGEDEDGGDDEIQGSHFFETNEICVNAGYEGTRDGELPHEGMNKDIPMNGMMDGSLMVDKRDIEFKEEINLLEEWRAKDTCDEYCTKVANPIQIHFTDWDEELNFLEERLLHSKVHIQHAQLELKERVVLKYIKVDEVADYDQ